ncbi:MAG: hypothetical protein K5848_08250 [Lachnospiraceae bacterium]|nr:hypothetical protein [Lachnospiraceae bacterium]
MADKEKTTQETGEAKEKKGKAVLKPNSIAIGVVIVLAIVISVVVILKNYKESNKDTAGISPSDRALTSVSDMLTNLVEASDIRVQYVADQDALLCIGSESFAVVSYSDNLYIYTGTYDETVADEAGKIVFAESKVTEQGTPVEYSVEVYEIDSAPGAGGVFTEGSIEFSLTVSAGSGIPSKGDVKANIPTSKS